MNKKPSHPNRVAQLKTSARANGVKQPVAPPVYKPEPKKTVQPKMANTTTASRKLPTAPPVYRPEQTPKVLQTKKAPGQTVQKAQAPRATAAPATRRQTIQRSEKIPGFPGFFFGELPQENRGGTFNTVWSETETPPGNSTVSHSSVPLSKGSRQHLVSFAQVTHLEDEENTHAEDRLAVYAHQLAIQMSFTQGGKVPTAIHIPEFFVSASPCSSSLGTSGKSTGCTENLVSWAKTGLPVKSEMGCSTNVKVTIGKLIVNKLYKSNSYDGAIGSMAALIFLKKQGAIGGWQIENDPPLDTGKIPHYSRTG